MRGWRLLTLAVWLGAACSRSSSEAPAPAAQPPVAVPQPASGSPSQGEPEPAPAAQRIPGAGASAAGAPQADSPAARYFGDTELMDQSGRKVRFYSDLIRGKMVVINVFFSRCTGVCPVMARSFGKLQAELGDRLGKDVFMISISVDPTHDSPELLQEYAKRVNARPGWSFITGEKANVEAVLSRLGQAVKQPNDHSSIVFIGNDRTGLWKKAFGLAKPKELGEIMWSVVNDQGPETETH
jgi:protein SCO1/2